MPPLAFVVARLLTRDHPPLAMAMGFVAFSLSFWNFGRWLPFEPEQELGVDQQARHGALDT